MACRILQNSLRSSAFTNTVTYSILRHLHLQTVVCAAKAGAKKGGAAAPSKKKLLQVETDPKILCTRLCGGNFNKEGEDPVLGADTDYPEWLWSLRTSPEAVPVEELDKDDYRYWRRLRRLTIRQKNALRK